MKLSCGIPTDRGLKGASHMARTRSFDTEGVLETAMTVFWKKGFSATSMSDIYEATGLKPSSIYAAFNDKDGLFRAAFERNAKHFHASFPENARGLSAIVAWLDIQADLAGADPERKGCMIVNTISERALHTPETQELAQARLAEITDYFRQRLLEAREDDDISSSLDIDRLADGLTSMVLGLMMLGRAGAPAEQIKSAADLAKQSILDAAN